MLQEDPPEAKENHWPTITTAHMRLWKLQVIHFKKMQKRQKEEDTAREARYERDGTYAEIEREAAHEEMHAEMQEAQGWGNRCWDLASGEEEEEQMRPW